MCPDRSSNAALYALIDTLSPANLTVPPQLMPLLSAGFGGNSDRQTDIEIIPTAGGPVFDPLEATEIGAAQTLDSLLNPQRLNRLEIQHSSDASVPAPSTVFDFLIERTMASAGLDVGRRIATTSVLALARVQRNPALSPTVALELSSRLERLAERLQKARGGTRRATGAADSPRCSGPRSARQGGRRPRPPAASPAGNADRDGRSPLAAQVSGRALGVTGSDSLPES